MFGLYLHIPFCEKKCIYCDFYSIERTEEIDVFTENICREIIMRANTDTTFPQADTVFFGGGTPSLLSPSQMEKILSTLRQHFSIAATAEITMECNPGTVTHDSLSAYRSLGINRLSFGVQSFDEQELQFLQRIHSPQQAMEAMALARAAGFDNVNMDLMFALPDQNKKTWQNSLHKMIALQPDHISAYSLIFEEGTPLFALMKKGLANPAKEEHDAELYEIAIETLSAAGYVQYEVSNFAKSGKQCRHNVLYWSGDRYCSFGPSAHGFIGDERYWNFRSLRRYSDYIQRGILPIANKETLQIHEQMFERAFLELRAKGIRLEEFMSDFSLNIEDIMGDELLWWKQNHWAHISQGRLSLLAKGYALCDELTLTLIALLEKETESQWEQKEYSEERDDEPVFSLPIL